MQYIFYSEDGYCESPTGEQVENFQVLGTTNGNNEQQARKINSEKAIFFIK